MTDNRLRIFVAVAECRSFTEAAHRLGMSQPAVNQSIAQTEADAGCDLIVRGRGDLSLTPAGDRFLLYSKRILALYDSLNSELSGSPAAPENSTLDLGDGRSAVISAADGKLVIDIK